MLKPGERSLFGYFGTSDDAHRAADKLKAMGYRDVQVARISKYGISHDDEYNNPIMGRAETVTGLTLYSANTGRPADADTRTLLVSDPSVSGFAGAETAGGQSYLVTVVTDDAGFSAAEAVLKEHGAKF